MCVVHRFLSFLCLRRGGRDGAATRTLPMSRGRGRVWRWGLRSFRSPPSRVSGRNRKRWDGKGRARLGCSPPGARPSALEEETSRGAPERAAAGVPLRESLAVFRWGSLRIVKSQLRPRSLPSFRARDKGNPLPRTSPPRPFRKSKPCRVAGRRSAAPHPLARRPGGNLTRPLLTCRRISERIARIPSAFWIPP